MAFTVFMLSLGVSVFVLTNATASVPEEIPSLGEPTSHVEEEEFVVKTTVSPTQYEPHKGSYTRSPVEIINGIAVIPHYDVAETVTSGAGSQPTTEAQSSQGRTPDTSTDSQPTTEAQSSQGQTAATTVSPAPPCVTPPPGDEAVSRLRNLSSEEKGRRLAEASAAGRVGEVVALLAVGADVGRKGWKRWTALHYAAGEGHMEVARLLVGCGAEVNARGDKQITPLHWAAVWGRTAAARLLLAASADPNARDNRARTPLHDAAYEGHAETAAALLEFGADREARDDRGRTPLDIARTNNKQLVIEVLTGS